MTAKEAGDTIARPTAKGIAVALIVGCVLAVLAAEGVLRVVMPHWREFYSGWFMRVVEVPDHGRVTTGRPGFDGHFAQNNGDFRVRIRVNAFGLRNPDPVEKAADRVWFVGDSMTFGWGVELDEIYSSVAGRLAGQPVYNVASPGANVCGYQALLARMPADGKPRAVILGLILENDVVRYDCRADARQGGAARGDGGWRATEVKMLLTRNLALYNFFAVGLKRVAFVNQALIGLGLVAKGHAYALPLTAETLAPAVERTAAEVAAFRAMLPAGTPFAVLIAPTRFEVRDGDPFSRRLRLDMEAALAKAGIAVIDPLPAFVKAGFGPTHFAHDGHWSPLGHAIAGRAVADWLRGRPLGN